MDFRELLNTAEYDFLRTDPRLGKRIILLGLSGSYGYGTNREGSDIDFRGVTLNLPSDILGLTTFEQFEDRETDTVIYGFNKLIGLLLNCNPNTIEILGLDDDQYLIKSPLGQELLDHKQLFLSKRAAASFGQTFNITPLQMITAVSACCNGGYLMKPYVVDRVEKSDGTVERTEPTVVRQVISETTSRQVNAILEQVVCDTAHGTGKNAYVAGYRVAGKTGTSEKVAQDAAGGAKEYIVSFIGYAPADDPRVVCLILMDTPSSSTGIYISGGQMAAPVVGRVLSDVLPCLGVEPRYTEAEQSCMDRPVPDLTGLDRTQAAQVLKENGLSGKTLGEGASVTDQIPAAGTVVAPGSTILLLADTVMSEETAVIPDLRGMTYTRARETLAEQGLFLRSDGTILADSDTVKVAFQSLAPGESASLGTVMDVTLVNNDDESFGIY